MALQRRTIRKMRIGIYTCATDGYQHAMTAQARRVVANLSMAKQQGMKLLPTMYLVTDRNETIEKAFRIYEESGMFVEVVAVVLNLASNEERKNYDKNSQLLIAQMRTAAHERMASYDFVWSLDSDVLPHASSLRCMLTMLEFDHGWYDVAFCPYPSQGGGGFLGGHGSPRDPIFPDSYEDEKEIPEKLTKEREKLRKRVEKPKDDDELHESQEGLREIEKEIRRFSPGKNVFALNAEGWRRRGWFDQAYPAIGQGAVVPVDWIGFGNTLMSAKAAALCDWAGYDGAGTEDLFVCWRRWDQAGIRTCAIPHCPSDHVIRSEKGPEMIYVSHETDGEFRDHLRRQKRPWFTHDPGETADPGE